MSNHIRITENNVHELSYKDGYAVINNEIWADNLHIDVRGDIFGTFVKNFIKGQRYNVTVHLYLDPDFNSEDNYCLVYDIQRKIDKIIEEEIDAEIDGGFKNIKEHIDVTNLVNEETKNKEEIMYELREYYLEEKSDRYDDLIEHIPITMYKKPVRNAVIQMKREVEEKNIVELFNEFCRKVNKNIHITSNKHDINLHPIVHITSIKNIKENLKLSNVRLEIPELEPLNYSFDNDDLAYIYDKYTNKYKVLIEKNFCMQECYQKSSDYYIFITRLSPYLTSGLKICDTSIYIMHDILSCCKKIKHNLHLELKSSYIYTKKHVEDLIIEHDLTLDGIRISNSCVNYLCDRLTHGLRLENCIFFDEIDESEIHENEINTEYFRYFDIRLGEEYSESESLYESAYYDDNGDSYDSDNFDGDKYDIWKCYNFNYKSIHGPIFHKYDDTYYFKIILNINDIFRPYMTPDHVYQIENIYIRPHNPVGYTDLELDGDIIRQLFENIKYGFNITCTNNGDFLRYLDLQSGYSSLSNFDTNNLEHIKGKYISDIIVESDLSSQNNIEHAAITQSSNILRVFGSMINNIYFYKIDLRHVQNMLGNIKCELRIEECRIYNDILSSLNVKCNLSLVDNTLIEKKYSEDSEDYEEIGVDYYKYDENLNKIECNLTLLHNNNTHAIDHYIHPRMTNEINGEEEYMKYGLTMYLDDHYMEEFINSNMTHDFVYYSDNQEEYVDFEYLFLLNQYNKPIEHRYMSNIRLLAPIVSLIDALDKDNELEIGKYVNIFIAEKIINEELYLVGSGSRNQDNEVENIKKIFMNDSSNIYMNGYDYVFDNEEKWWMTSRDKMDKFLDKIGQYALKMEDILCCEEEHIILAHQYICKIISSTMSVSMDKFWIMSE